MILTRTTATLLLVSLLVGGCATVEFPEVPTRATLGSPLPQQVIDSSSDHFFGPETFGALHISMADNKPMAWGRYIINTAARNPGDGGVRELTIAELARLSDAGLGLVPIVTPDQSTLHGSTDQGKKLAQQAVALVRFILFGAHQRYANTSILVFLDIEGTSPVSDEFLIGWCEGMRENKLGTGLQALPGVYTSAGLLGRQVRLALQNTVGRCPIQGLWLAQYVNLPPQQIPATWRDFREDRAHRLPALPDGIPVYLWQYRTVSSHPSVDYSLVNPELADEFAAQVIK